MEEPRPFRIIRRHDLPKYVGLQRTQIAELIKSGQFPRPISLNDNGRSVGWLEDEVIAWQRQRLSKRDSSQN
jgi:predicted DNA-binding transcriptional regulator AlpA